ncbi:MAG: phosphotransferase [Polyangiaceae bacterium]
MIDLPAVANDAELDALRADVSLWRPPVERLLREVGVPPLPLVDLGGANLVLGVGDHLVLKLSPATFGPVLDVERESLLLTTRAVLPIPSPQVRAYGSLGAFHYLLSTRLPGRPLEQDSPDRVDVCKQLGRWLAQLHAAPPPTTWPRSRTWDVYMPVERARAAERQARWRVPPELVADMPAWLAAADLETEQRPRALLHADVHQHNILCERDADGTRVRGVIDFGDALIGDPFFDLVTPALLIGQCDPACVAALLDGYGVAESARDEALLKRLTAYAILHKFNDLSRVLRWAGRSVGSLTELAKVMFPGVG